MTEKKKYKYRTRQFPNNASGQNQKLQTIEKFENDGWEVVEETIQPGQFNGGDACCLFIICAPLAFFAYKNGRIVVSFRKAG